MVYLLRKENAQGIATHWANTIPQVGFEAIGMAELVRGQNGLLIVDESGFPLVPIENFVG